MGAMTLTKPWPAASSHLHNVETSCNKLSRQLFSAKVFFESRPVTKRSVSAFGNSIENRKSPLMLVCSGLVTSTHKMNWSRLPMVVCPGRPGSICKLFWFLAKQFDSCIFLGRGV